MFKVLSVFLGFGFAVIKTIAAPADLVLSKQVLPRYQYIQGPNGLHLEDLWLKVADFSKALIYHPDQQNIYYLFTRAHPNVGYPLLLGKDSLVAQADFNPGRRTIVLVHGWLGSVLDGSNVAQVPAFLSEDVNVLVVDWSAGARGNYMSSVANTVTSGESAARFINWLNNLTGASVRNYHIVGHSLGGHQAGIIGRNVQGDVPYITALDPAMPLWILNPNKLRADDASYTEVIHTNVGQAGHPGRLGHVDFYPNGGIHMPGCDGQHCDHERCFLYMAESVKTMGFMGTECLSRADAMAGVCVLSGRLRMGGTKPKTGYWYGTLRARVRHALGRFQKGYGSYFAENLPEYF